MVKNYTVVDFTGANTADLVTESVKALAGTIQVSGYCNNGFTHPAVEFSLYQCT